MNRLAGIGALIVLSLVGVAVYFHFNPHHMPEFLSNPVQGFQVPEVRSPVRNVRMPQL